MINPVQFGKINVYDTYQQGDALAFNIGVTNEGEPDKRLFQNEVIAMEEQQMDHTMGGWEADEWRLTAYIWDEGKKLSVLGGHKALSEGNFIEANRVKSDYLRSAILYRLLQQPVAAGTYPTLDINA